jgi:hypothetical protein
MAWLEKFFSGRTESWVWWNILVISELRRQRQMDQEFKAKDEKKEKNSRPTWATQ